MTCRAVFFVLLAVSLGGCAAPLHRAAAKGDIQTLNRLLDAGANINEGHFSAMVAGTPLDYAAYRCQVKAAQLLLERGADLDVSEWKGMTARDWAVAGGCQPLVKLFERESAKAEARMAAADLGDRAQAGTAPSGPAAPRISSDVDGPPPVKVAPDVDAYAIVIGIEKYSNDLPDARFAERDAEAVRNHLIALGYPERNIKFLTGARASKSNLEAYLQDWLPRNVKEDGKVFFYFSGHGAPDPVSGQAFLVPSDGSANFLQTTGYPVKKLYAALGALKAKQVIVALDSCFSGTGGRSVLPKGARPLVNKVDISVGAAGKIVLFTASSENEISSVLEDQGHGIFTYYFLKGLSGAAQDGTGAVTARGLYDYLKPKVQDAANRQNRDQTPMLEGATEGELLRFK